LMTDKYYRSTYLNVVLNAIVANFQVLPKIHTNKTVMPIVTANAYGLVSEKIARYLMDHGADFFGVATLDEAIELRMHGIDAKILILGVIPTYNINKAIQHRVAITIPSKAWLRSEEHTSELQS